MIIIKWKNVVGSTTINQTFSSKTKTSQFSVSQHKCKHSTCEPTSTVSKNFAPSFRDSSVRIIMSFFTSNLTVNEKNIHIQLKSIFINSSSQKADRTFDIHLPKHIARSIRLTTAFPLFAVTEWQKSMVTKAIKIRRITIISNFSIIVHSIAKTQIGHMTLCKF